MSGPFRVSICLLALLCSALGSSSTSSTPRRPLDAFISNKKLVVGAVAAAPLLYLGKKATDGPVYKGAPRSMQGKDVVITGANTGLGKEAAITLASLGANVVLLCRSAERGAAAVEDIKRESESDSVSSIVMDLGDLNSIEKGASEVRKYLKSGKIDVLMNNAGVMAIPQRETTVQGFEKHLGINHIGHFALTKALLPLVEKSEAGRVVTVSSIAHQLGHLNREDLLLEQDGAYSPWPAYGNSKLANILFTKALATRLQAKGSKTLSLVCHPGVCRTELGRYLFDPSSVPKALYPVLGVVAAPAVYFTKSAKQGAQTQIFLAASPSISAQDTGSYYDNSAVADTTPESKDTGLAEFLWTKTESLIGSKFVV